jgi:hypothetical protein
LAVALIAVDAPANAPLGRHGHHEVSGPGYRRRRWPRGCARRPIDEFNPIEHENPANIAGWKDGWAVRGVYVNNFVFLLTRAERPLHVEAAKRRPRACGIRLRLSVVFGYE